MYMNIVKKIVVFDLDETLGYFTELGIFCDCLNRYYNNQEFSNKYFVEILDLYPEFIRPKILHILKYLVEKKKRNKCYKVMVYTNNQGPKSWCKLITKYFDSKVGYKLFDKIIAAFEVNGERVEMGRTSHNKSVDDLIKCTKLPKNIDICFIDDVNHPGMSEENVYYINVKPYHYRLTINQLILRFLDSELGQNIKNKSEFINIIEEEFKQYHYRVHNKSNDEQDIDTIIGKKILEHIKQFFYENNNKTLKRGRRVRNRSLKVNKSI